jgi:hypothetical protein
MIRVWESGGWWDYYIFLGSFMTEAKLTDLAEPPDWSSLGQFSEINQQARFITQLNESVLSSEFLVVAMD